MAGTSLFYHRIANTTSLNLTNANAVARSYAMDLNASQSGLVGNTRFRGFLNTITINFTTLVTAASVVVTICKDAAGDQPIGAFTITLQTGVTTATSGGGSVKMDIGTYLTSPTVYFFFRTNAGTLTLTNCELTWTE